MFGRFRNRGMFRRAIGRLDQSSRFPTERQANQLMKTGQYFEAAPVFARLAQAAQGAGQMQRAVSLYARSALAGAASGDAEFALEHARQALHAIQQMGMLMRASGVMTMILLELKNSGLANVAAQLQLEFAGQFDQAALTPALKSQAPQPNLRLPATCPQCGAPVRSDEVEWIDGASAACAFCGGVIQAQ